MERKIEMFVQTPDGPESRVFVYFDIMWLGGEYPVSYNLIEILKADDLTPVEFELLPLESDRLRIEERMWETAVLYKDQAFESAMLASGEKSDEMRRELGNS